ncbi:MAG TPA: Crp/Fnr family transcriptional regulator [Candidatus Binatia bacterium]|nr:Crp/Fnr family transcriptional regulator [Candidatus Binatia bacterium]
MTRGAATTQKRKPFDPKTFLSVIDDGRQLETIAQKKPIFLQGEPSDTIFYIQKGKVQLTVTSTSGKEAVIGLLKEGDFLGENCLTGEPLRLCSAIALTDCSLMRIEKNVMIKTLHEEPALSEVFVAYLLARNIQYEADLVDQLSNSSEKRLARILLMLANFGKEGAPETMVPKINQETLAEMVGTTRSRVNFFMNKFRKLGFINYDTGGSLQVHSSLLNVVLHD